MITAILWIVLSTGEQTAPVKAPGLTCAQAVEVLKKHGYRLNKGDTLYCQQGFEV